jgi:hypothetical protein
MTLSRHDGSHGTGRVYYGQALVDHLGRPARKQPSLAGPPDMIEAGMPTKGRWPIWTEPEPPLSADDWHVRHRRLSALIGWAAGIAFAALCWYAIWEWWTAA